MSDPTGSRLQCSRQVSWLLTESLSSSLAVPACSGGSGYGRSGTDTDDVIDTKLLRIHSNNVSPIAARALQPLQHPCMLSRQQPALACLWHCSSRQDSSVAEQSFNKLRFVFTHLLT